MLLTPAAPSNAESRILVTPDGIATSPEQLSLSVTIFPSIVTVPELQFTVPSSPSYGSALAGEANPLADKANARIVASTVMRRIKNQLC